MTLPWRARISRALVLTFMFAAFGGLPASAQEAPATLQGETFTSYSYTITPTCNEDGTSTIRVIAQGTASGPYPGTFTETATFTITPQAGVSQVPGFPAGDVVDFAATFTIDSVNGTVSGTKTMRAEIIPRQGTCASVGPNEYLDSLCLQDGPGPGLSEGADLSHATAAADYEARIRTSEGMYSDTGLALASIFDMSIYCQFGSRGAIGFFEFFYSSNGVVALNTPGRAQGGGQIEHPVGTSAASATTFGLTVQSDGERIIGQCNVYDQAIDQHLVCETVTDFAQIGNTAIFSGTALIDGELTDFTIEVEDGGESGIGVDSFTIETGSGYARSGLLTEGNIQVGHGSA